MTDNQGSIFFITPIGQPNSSQRSRADVVQKAVQSVATELGLSVIRADDKPMSGQISVQVVEAIRDAKVLVADLVQWGDGPNGNVMYELGIADTLGKHVVLIRDSNPLPFDVSGMRALTLESTEWQQVEDLKPQLASSLREALRAVKDGIPPVSAVSSAKLNARYLDEFQRKSDPDKLTELAEKVLADSERIEALERAKQREEEETQKALKAAQRHFLETTRTRQAATNDFLISSPAILDLLRGFDRVTEAVERTDQQVLDESLARDEQIVIEELLAEDDEGTE